MKKTIAVIVSVLFVLSFAGLSFAAEKAATAEKMMEKKAPTKVKQVTGKVVSCDVSAGALTVKGRKGDVTVSTNDKTRIKAGTEKKTLADIQAGDKVTVKYTEADGKNMAKSIAIKPATMAKGKKMEKKMKKAAPPAE